MMKSPVEGALLKRVFFATSSPPRLVHDEDDDDPGAGVRTVFGSAVLVLDVVNLVNISIGRRKPGELTVETNQAFCHVT